MYVVYRLRLSVNACVIDVCDKAQVQIISKREFKLWTILRVTESAMATFHAKTCVMSHRSIKMCKDECVNVCGGGVCVCLCICAWVFTSMCDNV